MVCNFVVSYISFYALDLTTLGPSASSYHGPSYFFILRMYPVINWQ